MNFATLLTRAQKYKSKFRKYPAQMCKKYLLKVVIVCKPPLYFSQVLSYEMRSFPTAFSSSFTYMCVV